MPASADNCSVSGSTETCTGAEIPNGVIVNAGPTTLDVNSLTTNVNGEVGLFQNAGNGGGGHDGALFVSPSSGGSGGSGQSGVTVVGTPTTDANGVVTIFFSDDTKETLTPLSSTQYSQQLYKSDGKDPPTYTANGSPTTIDATFSTDNQGNLVISLGTNGSLGKLTIAPGSPGPSPSGGLNLVYVGTPKTLTTANQAGVIAVSVGGSGGNGGTYYVGGGGAHGGNGGNGGDVFVSATGDINVTNGYGVLAQSIGGHGGNGGGSEGAASASGGDGGNGGAAGTATAEYGGGTLITTGDNSVGVAALSQGGHGGSGGDAGGIVASSGDAAGAGEGKKASAQVDSGATVETSGDNSHTILAQSVGGSGGNSGSAGGVAAAGGGGGSGGDAGEADGTNNGHLITHGDHADGILAQSVGGGGGQGDSTGGLSALGSTGGAGGSGGAVNATNGGAIETHGYNSTGIFAQSIGGGGGDGGSTSGFKSIGGGGSAASNSGIVTVTNTGLITTDQSFSDGIFAQSVGGGGGNGGAAGGLGALSVFTVGGSGALGGEGGKVVVYSGGSIETGLDAKLSGNSGDVTDSEGIFAQSVGGGGGNGGSAVGVGLGLSLVVGGSGGTANNGDVVQVNRAPDAADVSSITTWGDRSTGIFAQSVGGGGGNGGFALSATAGPIAAGIALGGQGGKGGDASTVTVNTDGTIATHGNSSDGILAQSIGGGGGNGGLAVAGSVGAVTLSLAVGGHAGDGGAASTVTIDNWADITTAGDDSTAIFAQSVGGGGGNGGDSIAAGVGLGSIAFGIGGTGGKGGAGAAVAVTNGDRGTTGDPVVITNISTSGVNSDGIIAQSIGGGGGNGGMSIAATLSAISVPITLGGNGATGSDGGVVMVDSLGAITTAGDNSTAIFAQSIGGGGGNGGFAVSGGGSILGASVGLGGPGGGAGNGHAVTVTSTGNIWTQGSNAGGIVAQSIGGSGGNGGFAVAGQISAAGGIGVAVGDSGGVGGNGDTVIVNAYASNPNPNASPTDATLETDGANSTAILAQSIGGGGGNGGFAGAISLSGGIAASVALGGSGGSAGHAGTVTVTSGDRTSGAVNNILTKGDDSAGIVAQSLGGGGGNGGLAVSFSGTLPVEPVSGSLAVSLGGSGGMGNAAKAVSVTSTGMITTQGAMADAVLAQSIGGGGGNGGLSIAGSFNVGGLGSASVAIGGSGGDGASGSTATIDSVGQISTSGDGSSGLVAQSIGGGGGNGGFAGAAALATSVAISVGVGGTGGAGGSADTVGVTNVGNIFTAGSNADAILAQSIGGGGGNGGSAIGVTLSGAAGISVAIGRSGGTGGDAAGVTVGSNGSIVTGGYTIVDGMFVPLHDGSGSAGIVAQSIGGGGGNGGFSGTIALGDAAALGVALGGHGATGGKAGDVHITNGDTVVSNITTFDDLSSGIVAQSIGGGGGNGGFGASLSGSGGVALSATLGGGGGAGATAGSVTVTSTGTIATYGDLSDGIVAQSLGGGGGNGGFALSGDAALDGAAGITLGGSGGTGSESSSVTVISTGDIFTAGDGSNGILAQSIGGGGGNGGFAGSAALSNAAITIGIGGSGAQGAKADFVEVTSTGAITTRGSDANGILAQSIGGGGGNGGSSVGLGLGGTAALSVTLGSKAGSGGDAGTVTVDSNGTIATGSGAVVGGRWVAGGSNSAGILAQSIGGGGGNGGFSGAVDLAGTGSLGVTLGGAGGDGGAAADVTVTNGDVTVSDITTFDDLSGGIVAQSIGGSGGNGGFGLDLSGAGTASLTAAVGGAGGTAATGGSVTVTSTGAITTFGNLSDGIFAQSVGGGGGNGGFALSGALALDGAASVAVGGKGGAGSESKSVTVTSTGAIETYGDGSNGIFAQSIGGGGGNGGLAGSAALSQAAIAIGLGGLGADGGNADFVLVTSTGAITTSGSNSNAILAQSIGGGGGNGGSSVGLAVGEEGGLSVAIGRSAGSGGNAGTVTVVSQGDIVTGTGAVVDGKWVAGGSNSAGIVAQSIGGGGGNGGFSGSLAIGGTAALGLTLGGAGGGGGNADNVAVTSGETDALTGKPVEISNITTYDDLSAGIVAQSIGGGGGNGGFGLSVAAGGNASLSAAVGGKAGSGSSAGTVTVDSTGAITTYGNISSGILAQSVGGGGGNGGFALSGSLAVEDKAVGASVGVGGDGGGASSADDVTVTSNGDIITYGSLSSGIQAQSLGGSGGNGGFAVSAAITVGQGVSAGVAVGGGGGAGGRAGEVTVTSTGAISTFGSLSSGILAQSLGGDGGNGGFAVSAAATFGDGAALSAAVGGPGGDGGVADKVTVTSTGAISTAGDLSSGILAQSIGGGGGNGGFAVAGSLAVGGQDAALTVTIGGSGGDSASAGDVEADSTGNVTTLGQQSSAIVAQSIGGSGGNGGFAGALGADFGKGGSIGVSIGGTGGAGATAGTATVNSIGNIATGGDGSNGILAQSIGGGGGNGGVSVAATAAVGETGTSLSASVGGGGGDGGTGSSVKVTSVGTILTLGAQANGIFAQSVGGGGGNGGFSIDGSLGVTDESGTSAAVSIGGFGGDGETSGNVVVKSNVGAALANSNATIETDGASSNGIFAQSIGGGGGNGGFSGALSLAIGEGSSKGFGVSIGGFGGGGNNAGTVDVTSVDNILTKGDGSNGILAQSIGGGGGNGGFSAAATLTSSAPTDGTVAVSLSLGGFGAEGGDADTVTVTSTGLIDTSGDHADGVLAQSIGGGGGNGGLSVSGAISPAGNSTDVGVTVGGFGSGGGTGGTVIVTRNGDIGTTGDYSVGIAAQSIGGGGGNGGMAISGAFGNVGEGGAKRFAATLGGFGGAGTSAGKVIVGSTGTIVTTGLQSQAILAQSIGGGGGTGGLAGSVVLGNGGADTTLNFGATIGGSGGGGGLGEDVTVTDTAGYLSTSGTASQGILAQSIGGGGGNGGSSMAAVMGLSGATVGRTVNAAVTVGGQGGSGNTAGNVEVKQSGGIKTTGDGSHGIEAQSIGGGGGNGGQANSLSLVLTANCTLPVACTKPPEVGNNIGLNVSVGGFGGTGNDAGTVDVNNSGFIITSGQAANGILAQSIGGGGGEGGNGILGLTDLVPDPYDDLTIALKPFSGVGIAKNLQVAIGGYGGTAGDGKLVTVENTGQVQTSGSFSWGIFAQSVGGGGGSGGNSVAGLLGTVGIGGGAFADDLGVHDTGSAGDGGTVIVTNGTSSATAEEMGVGAIVTTGPVSSGAIFAQSVGGGGGQGGAGSGLVDIGGEGGSAGDGGSVGVTNYAYLSTAGIYSDGINAQSVGGGGGMGGGGGLALFTLGGSGKSGGNGGDVSVVNSGNIATAGDESNGIVSQSVGGGGGRGGGYVAADADIVGSPSLVELGGAGGSAGNGMTAGIQNSGYIGTAGAFANGLFAQSVGGGGGIGGNAFGAVTFGGAGGSSGNGGAVTIDNSGGETFTQPEGPPITLSIVTTGDNSDAILAQSIGGGGGASGQSTGVVSFGKDSTAGSNGGIVTVTNSGNLLTTGINSTAIFAQSVGGGGGYVAAATGLLWADSGDAGAGGNGGKVTVTNTASLIQTTGANAQGIFAQSIGGGGGVVNAASGTISTNWGVPAPVAGVITDLVSDAGLGIGFAGSAGGAGAAGDIVVNQTGTIYAEGQSSFGILGQSAGATNGNIAITVNAGSTIIGGTGTGAAVGFLDGASNTLSNAGLLTDLGTTTGLAFDADKNLVVSGWLDGRAVFGTMGNEAVTNTDYVTGNVDLGGGTNTFDNKQNGWFVMGSTVSLGNQANDLYTNEGYMTPGGINKVFTTNETGSFTQTASGIYMLDDDLDPATDVLNVTGTASLAGTLAINILNPGNATPGETKQVIVATGQGVVNNGMAIDAAPSAVATYSLLYTANDAILDTKITFAPGGLTENGTRVGSTINQIQTVQNSPAFVPLAAALFFQPNSAALNQTYNSIDGEGTAGVQQTFFNDTDEFINAVMHQADVWRTDDSADLSGYVTGDCAKARPGEKPAGAQKPASRTLCDPRTWRAWITGYAGGSTFDGDQIVGSGQLHTNDHGMAAGLDYQIDPNYLVGLAVGGGTSGFSVDSRATTGDVGTGHAAFYGAAKEGSFYANGLISYDYFHANTNRYAMLAGTGDVINPVPGFADQLASAFGGYAISGRAELGYKKDLGTFSLTPFGAVQFSSLTQDEHVEHPQGTPGTLAVDYARRTVASLPTFLGAQLDARFDVSDAFYVEPFVRASWVHEFERFRSVNGSFIAAPGYDYIVYGAAAPRDSARVEGGVNIVSGTGWSVYGKFKGDLAKSAHDMSGSGGVRFAW